MKIFLNLLTLLPNRRIRRCSSLTSDFTSGLPPLPDALSAREMLAVVVVVDYKKGQVIEESVVED